MARDYIKIIRTDSAATQASPMLEFLRNLRTTYEQGVKIKAIMDHLQDGTTWTDIETVFGLPAGTGHAVYDLVNGTVGAMNGTFQNNNAVTLTEKVG